jgi:hypothetical protein
MYGENVKLLVLYAREQMWNGWHYMHGNKRGIVGYLCISVVLIFTVTYLKDRA